MADHFEGERIAEARIAEAKRTGQDWLDLGGLGLTGLPPALFGLTGLRRLNLGRLTALTAEEWGWARVGEQRTNRVAADLHRVVALQGLRELSLEGSDCDDLMPITGLILLQQLICGSTQVIDLAPIAWLAQLQHLDCSDTQVTDLTPIAHLVQLQHLDCGSTQVNDLAPIARLAQLQHLDCSFTQVSDLLPIAGLTQLQHLSFSSTQVSDLAPVARLAMLRRLHCGSTQVSDLAPISRLAQLQHLDCSDIRLSDLAPIARLAQLQHLGCGSTPVNNLTPIADLAELRHVDCSATQVSDLMPMAGLVQLLVLYCGSTQVRDLAPLAGLAQLQHLDCCFTHVSDLAPIADLAQLQQLSCSGNTLDDTSVEIWSKPSLQHLDLYDTRVPGIPDEALGYDCLDRLRAHLAELAAGSETIHDAKLLILGNGRAGKTQIARRLANQPFQGHWDSTHGIRVTQATLPAQDGVPETSIKLWDFGGQDIYHGTHALFVRSRALFLLAWSKETEAPESDPDPHGMVFRNHPLRYWVDYVRHLGRAGSPVVIAQTRVDMDGVLAPPLDGIGDLNATTVQVSSADPPQLGALRGALQEASAALFRQRGAVTIGKPRICVQRRIEGMRRADGSMPDDHRLIEKATFEAWYTEAGGNTDAEFALAYLNDNGTLFYRKGLFGDRVVLDHAWAMNAIYAVFDRKSATYARLQRRGGLFERADLAAVWHDFTEAEQRLFLGMMRSCGICFVYRGPAYRPEDDDDTTYLAPDLLPDRAAIQPQIDATWGHGAATHRQVFTYPFLHHGLIRGVVARLGELAQTRADYFRGGVRLYDARTQSRALVAQAMAPGEWTGTVTIETRDGQAELLLERLADLVRQENDSLGLTSTTDRARPERDRRKAPDTAPLIQAARPPSDADAFAVSYAWNDTTPSGPDRESRVDALCEAAEQRGEHVLRDKTDLRPGERIDRFTDRIGRAGRVFVFISRKYLESEYCMQELATLWTRSQADDTPLHSRALFYFLDVSLKDSAVRDQCAAYWKERIAREDRRRAQMGAEELKMHQLMARFLPDIPDVLYRLGNTVRHQDVEALLRDGFPARPE